MSHRQAPMQIGVGGLYCPRCGARFDDDGDRRIDDECFECGWQTEYRRARNAENARTFAAIRKEQER